MVTTVSKRPRTGSQAVRIPWPPPGRRKFPKGISEDVCLSELARATGISLAHISRIFAGTRRPSMGTALKIADYLKMSIGTLYSILVKCAK